MEKLTSEEILKYLIALIHMNLEELKSAEEECGGNLFISGEKVAYVECLEVLQMWQEAISTGLDYDIELRYPVG